MSFLRQTPSMFTRHKSNNHQNDHQSSVRKSYHHRSESSVLRTKRRSFSRQRSQTADSCNYHPNIPNKANKANKPKSTTKKQINRRFESIPELNHSHEYNIKYNQNNNRNDNNNDNHQYVDEKEKEISYHRHTSRPVNISRRHNNNDNEYYHQQLNDLVQQFREIVLPLQTEINSLRQITQQLQHQVNILQNENRLYRKHMYNYTNQSSPNAFYVDYVKNITPNHASFSHNPVYLFTPKSQRRTISMGTLETVSVSNMNDYQRENSKAIHKLDHVISGSLFKHEMDEEDALEIDGKHPSQIYLDIDNMDISDVGNVPATPISTPTEKSIDKTYNKHHQREDSSVSAMTDDDDNQSSSSPLLAPNYQLVNSSSLRPQHQRAGSQHNDLLNLALRDSVSLPPKVKVKSASSNSNHAYIGYHRKRKSFV